MPSVCPQVQLSTNWQPAQGMRLYQNRNSNDFILEAHKSFPIWQIVKNWNPCSCALSVKCKKHFLTEKEKREGGGECDELGEDQSEPQLANYSLKRAPPVQNWYLSLFLSGGMSVYYIFSRGRRDCFLQKVCNIGLMVKLLSVYFEHQQNN